MGSRRRGLDAHFVGGSVPSRGVDLQSRPAVPVLVAHLSGQAIVDENAKSYGDVPRGTFIVVVEAPVHHEPVAERNVAKRRTHRVAARRVLPQATTRFELEVSHHRGAHPKPWALGVAYEPMGRRQRTMPEAATLHFRMRPRTWL